MSTMSKGKRNFILVLINMTAAMVFFTPYLRFSYYDQMIAALNLSNQDFGNLAGVYGIIAMFGYLPSGLLADRFSPKLLLSISCFGMGACTIWHALFPGYTALLIIYALFGIFSVVTFWSPYLKCVRSLGSEAEQGRLFGTSEALRGGTATIVAFSCLGLLGLFVNGVQGFQALLFANAALFILFGILSILFLPNIEKGEKETVFNLQLVLQAVKNPGLWLVTLLIFCGYGLATFGANYLGTYGTQVLGVSEQLSSTFSIIRTYVLVIVGGVLGGILADRFKSRSLFIGLLFCVCGVTVGLILMTASTFIGLCIVLTFVLSFCYYTIKSLYFSTLGEAGIPFALTGISTGIISFIGLSPDVFITPMVGGWLDAGVESGFTKMFISMLVFGVVGIVATYLIYRRGKKLKETSAIEE